MDKLFQKIKEHPILTVLITITSIIILTIGVPLLIHLCFVIPAPFPFLVAKWESGSVLEYYGAILSFLGTAALSALALYQNYEIKREADAKQTLLEKIEREKEMPLFRIKNRLCNGNYTNLVLSIANISENVAFDISVSNFKVENEQGEIVVESKDAQLEKTELFGNEDTEIQFKNNALSGENLKIIFEMRCKDKFKEAHTYNVSFKIDDAKKFTGKTSYKIIEI